jgi:DNA-binding PadR family transcriptional regulator
MARLTTNSDQLHGTLDMLVLNVLANGPLHGYAIAVRRCTEWSGAAGSVRPGP